MFSATYININISLLDLRPTPTFSFDLKISFFFKHLKKDKTHFVHNALSFFFFFFHRQQYVSSHCSIRVDITAIV